jgi:radical SAM protein with 4Fe4S-binding SPASM domain
MEMKTHLRYPLWISWEITNKCNYKCIHCRMDELNDFNKELSTDEVISCINQLNEIGVYQINYSGGEPFLRNDFIDILEYTSKSNIKIGVTTNGSLIDEEIVKKLKMIKNLDFIQISLDGRDNATHNHIRGINGAYETAIETIRMLVNSNFNVGVVTTVMKPNVKQIPDILNKLTELGVNMFGARRFMPTGKGNNSADLLAVNTDEYCSHIHYWVDSINNKDNKVKCIIEEPLLSILRDKLPVSWKFDGCQAGDQYGAITANGDIRACIFIPVKLGNIKEQNFKSIWETSKIREKIILRELNGSCKVCNLIKECGGCRAAAYLNTGDYLGDDPMCFYKNT